MSSCRRRTRATVGVSRPLRARRRNRTNATAMAIAGKGSPPTTSKNTVYADFAQGRTPTGRWYVSQVRFHLSPGEQAEAVKAQAADAKAALKQRLLDKARQGR